MTVVISYMTLSAQDVLYKWDAGGGIGISGYSGEANDGFIYRRPGFSADLIGRYNFNSRLALGADANYMSLSGNTENMDNFYPGGIDYKFSASVYSVTVNGEFNFFPYGVGETYKQLKRWTPFISFGLGVLMSSVNDTVHAAFQIPFILGVKLKLKERLNLNVKLTAAKVFSDKLDGELADLYTIKSTFLKNTDWYSTLTVGLTYEFGERCPTCHRAN